MLNQIVIIAEEVEAQEVVVVIIKEYVTSFFKILSSQFHSIELLTLFFKYNSRIETVTKIKSINQKLLQKQKHLLAIIKFCIIENKCKILMSIWLPNQIIITC